MTLNVLQTLRGNHLALWATTYTFEPGLFDEFLFRQLGEPPLNVNVLVDAHRIARVWEEWADQPWRFRRVNRDYLVRPVRWGASAFHPKTYLLTDKRDGVLLVGSGNLGLRGLIEGKEVFCRFSSATEVGRAAIGSWRAWMQRLVDEQDDVTLAHRWRELTRSAPWLVLPPAPSPFLHNLDRPILDQLVETIKVPVDELHVLAPFYDTDARAFAALLKRMTPGKLVLYLPDGLSVSGERLVDVLGSFCGETRLLGFDDSAFVHAKLIGVVTGGDGVLLSGSPNCSGAALLSAGLSGNCEVAVLARTNVDSIRAAFVPPGWSTVERRLEDLLGLTFRHTEDSNSRWPVALESAAKLADDRIEVKYESPDGPSVASLRMGNASLPLAERRTVDPLPVGGTVGVVWLTGPEGQRLSNAVPVDFPQQLQSWLVERVPGDDRPRELWPEDLATGVGELLARLNHQCVFDIDETLAAAGALRGSDADEGGEDEASDFWEGFQADQLRLDFRIARYEQLLASDGSTPWYVDDDVYGLLTAMLHRTPDHTLRRVVDPNGGQGASTQTVKPQLQKRVGNLLSRWSKALNDRRFRWISPKFPVKNYIALLSAIIECWAKGYVGGERLSGITLTLLQSFVGSKKRRGYLLTLDDAERAEAIQALGPDARQVVAALVFTSLHPLTNWKAKVYEWQPVLVTAVELGVLEAGPTTSRWLEELPAPNSRAAVPIEPNAVDDHVIRLATYTDDNHWSLVQAEELGFGKVAITPTQGIPARTYPITVKVEGVQDLVVEPQVVSLVRRALSYRQVRGVIVEGAARGALRPQRLSVVMGGMAYGTVGSGDWDSDRELNVTDLVALEEQGRGFEALLRRDPSTLPVAG